MRTYGYKLVLGCLLGAWSFAVVAERLPRAALERVEVRGAPEAAAVHGVVLDLVFVYDAASLAYLPDASAEWFQQKPGLVALVGKGIDVVSHDAPPGFMLNDVILPKRHRHAIKVLGYANYPDIPGQAPVDLSRWSCVRIVLGAEGPRYEACR
jgi:hypothetical protein